MVNMVAYCHLYFISVTDKCSLQAQLLTEDGLILTDTSDTKVGPDIFDLKQSGV